MRNVIPILKDLSKQLSEKMSHRLTTREAVGFSVVLHMLAVSAIASFWAGDALHKSVAAPDLVFEIEPNLKAINSQPATADVQSGVRNQEAAKQSGRAGNNIRGNMNRDAYMMSAIASLNALKQPFGMKLQHVSQDSLGGFSPHMDGNVPGSIYDSFGRRKGEGQGSGSGIRISVGGGGGGYCPPGPTILP